MRVNLSRIIGVSCVALALMCGRAAYAQEGSPVSNDMPEVNNHSDINSQNDDKPLLSDPDAATRYQTPSNQSHLPAGVSQSQANKSKAKPADAKAVNKDEDALSFNFLYYIIQKFKKSDIVDD